MKRREVKMAEKLEDKIKKSAQKPRKVYDLNAEQNSPVNTKDDGYDSWGGDDSSDDQQNPKFRINKKKSPKNQQFAPVQNEREKRKKVDLEEDFMTFDAVNENAYISKSGKDKQDGKDDTESELENKMNKRFDRSRYPWLSKRTLKIKDIFLFLHSEILDFVEFVSQSKEDKSQREAVVNRIKNVVQKVYPEA